MFSLPGKIQPAKSNDLASSIDLRPTILKRCGLEPTAPLPGIDLLNQEVRVRRKQVFGAAYSIHNMTLGDPLDTLQYRWIITRRWKYLVRDHGVDTTRYKHVHLWDQTPEQLFDLQFDPGETKNVIASHPEVTTRLRGKLKAWLTPDD